MTPYVRYKAPRSVLRLDFIVPHKVRFAKTGLSASHGVQQQAAPGSVRRFRASLFRAASSSSAG